VIFIRKLRGTPWALRNGDMPENSNDDVRNLKSHYRSGRASLAKEFFAPCLAGCSLYRRAAGYFSSSALITWAAALPRLAQSSNVSIKVIASPQLSAEEKTFSLSLLKKRSDEADRKISEISDTVQLHKQTKLLQQLTGDARQLARDQIRALVLAACNKRLRKVLSQDPVELDRIGDCLYLAHQSGASTGQTLAVGYTFLMTVLNRGQNDFPLIVDSPANPLDAGRRRQIGALIPDLCSQFVGFTISTERLGFIRCGGSPWKASLYCCGLRFSLDCWCGLAS
jgi:hypothetical protein